MSPPAVLPHSGSGGSISAGASTQKAIRAAHALIADRGITMSPSKVSRLVRRFEGRTLRNGWTFPEFLGQAARLTTGQLRRALVDPDAYFPMKHKDKTGEDAVWNVRNPSKPPRGY